MPRRRPGGGGGHAKGGGGYDSFLNDLWDDKNDAKTKKKSTAAAAATTTTKKLSTATTRTTKTVERKESDGATTVSSAASMSNQVPPPSSSSHPSDESKVALDAGKSVNDEKGDKADASDAPSLITLDASKKTSTENEKDSDEKEGTKEEDNTKEDTLVESSSFSLSMSEKKVDEKTKAAAVIAPKLQPPSKISSLKPKKMEDETKKEKEVVVVVEETKKATPALNSPAKTTTSSAATTETKKDVVVAETKKVTSVFLKSQTTTAANTATETKKEAVDDSNVTLTKSTELEKVDNDEKKKIIVENLSKKNDDSIQQQQKQQQQQQQQDTAPSAAKVVPSSKVILKPKKEENTEEKTTTTTTTSPAKVAPPSKAFLHKKNVFEKKDTKATATTETTTTDFSNVISKKISSVSSQKVPLSPASPKNPFKSVHVHDDDDDYGTNKSFPPKLPATNAAKDSHNYDDDTEAPTFSYNDNVTAEEEERKDLISPLPSTAAQSPYYNQQSSPSPPSYNPLLTLLTLLYARLVYHCTYHRTESILFTLFLTSFLLFFHPSFHTRKIDTFTFTNSKIDDSLSSIHSKFDLHIGDVDHWCMSGNNDDCACEDPTEPSFREGGGWIKAHKRNVESIEMALGEKGLSEDIEKWDDDWDHEYDDDSLMEAGSSSTSTEEEEEELKILEENGYDQYGHEVGKQKSSSSSIDVVFLGDSITEQRQGTQGGIVVNEYNDIKTVFDKQFTKEKGGEFEGIALGLAGDTSPNLLWRIMNGEIPSNLNPSVFWITMGTNDILKTHCSEEIVLLGILRIVEEIQNRKPSSTIVINSILPTSKQSNGVLEYKGRFRKIRSGGSTVDVWPFIESVNKELEKFASDQPGVKFFDADKVFVDERSDGSKYILEGSMLPDHIHPSKEGHKAWGKAITKKLETILNKH